MDVGKVNQLSFDPRNELTSLSPVNISQACAKQRSGRAGRIQNGICFRLYSLKQYNEMPKFTMAEILRVSLAEICLKAKKLNSGLSIEAFLSECLEPPPKKNIQQSVAFLKNIDALDADENITPLGAHLVNMPVNCQFGKMILYSVLLRCIDPVLEIVSILSAKDPFKLPISDDQADKIEEIRQKFAENSLSDHKMLLNTNKTCTNNFISNGTMQMCHEVSCSLVWVHHVSHHLV